MKILVGDTMSKVNIEALEKVGWGRMFVTKTPNPYAGEPWGFDNGAFSAWQQGQRLSESRFMTRLNTAFAIGVPYISVCPDLPTEGLASLEYSLRWLEQLPPQWPWYLAVQDGMKQAEVESVLPKFAGLFLGGTTRFKSTAPVWQALAYSQGKRFHYARCGTLRRLEFARELAVDSLDSAFPLWTKERLALFMERAIYGSPQLSLLPYQALARQETAA